MAVSQLLRPLYDRMPVILASDDYAAWLGEDAARDAAELLRRYPSEGMRACQVGRPVDRVGNDGPECVKVAA